MIARPAVIVCERKPYWTPELQRQFVHGDILVRGCQKWSELAARSREFPRVVDVVEFTEENSAECLTGLSQRQESFPSPPLIMIASPRWAVLENVLREAGVKAFFPALPTGKDLAQCCRQWLDI